MEKEQIKQHKGWKYIESLSPKQRHSALFGNMKSEIEAAFNVTIQERPFTDLTSLNDENLPISVQSPVSGNYLMAVLIPK